MSLAGGQFRGWGGGPYTEGGWFLYGEVKCIMANGHIRTYRQTTVQTIYLQMMVVNGG